MASTEDVASDGDAEGADQSDDQSEQQKIAKRENRAGMGGEEIIAPRDSDRATARWRRRGGDK